MHWIRVHPTQKLSMGSSAALNKDEIYLTNLYLAFQISLVKYFVPLLKSVQPRAFDGECVKKACQWFCVFSLSFSSVSKVSFKSGNSVCSFVLKINKLESPVSQKICQFDITRNYSQDKITCAQNIVLPRTVHINENNST